MTIQSAALSHTQYLRQVLANVEPTWAENHNNRLWLAVNTYVQVGRYGVLNGWESDEREYLRGAGEKITAMKSAGDALAVLFPKEIYLITGNSRDSWGQTKIEDNRGTKDPRSVVSARSALWYRAPGGGYWAKGMSPEVPAVAVDTHAPTDAPESVALYGRGADGVSVHLHNGATLWRFDVDSLRIENGEASVSLFKITVPFALRLTWEADGKLWGIRESDGTIHQLDDPTSADTDHPMRVTFACPADSGQNSRTERVKVTTGDTDGQVKMRARRLMDPDTVTLRSADMDDTRRTREETGQAVRVYTGALEGAEDPHTPILTYECSAEGACLIEVAWYYREGVM